jgi:hypothetical protein
MLRARDGAQLLRDEADYQLHTLYVWYEKRPEEALAIVRRLQARHPHNPVFAQAAAEIEDVHLSDYASSLRSWQALLADARAGRVAWPEMTEARARLGVATQLDRLAETDLAIEHLRAVLAPAPAAHRGPSDREAAARRGARSHEIAGYRLSIEGWRALERGDTPRRAGARPRPRARPPPIRSRATGGRGLLPRLSATSTAAIDVLESVIASPARRRTSTAAACLDAAQALRAAGRHLARASSSTSSRSRRSASIRARRAARKRALARLAEARVIADPATTLATARRRQRCRSCAIDPKLDIRGEIGRGCGRRFLTRRSILCLTQQESHP